MEVSKLQYFICERLKLQLTQTRPIIHCVLTNIYIVHTNRKTDDQSFLYIKFMCGGGLA